MKKTVKELLEIIENQGVSVEDFGYGDFGAPDDFKFSEETARLKKAKETAWDKFSELYDTLSWEERNTNEELKALRQVWVDTPEWEEMANKEWLDSIGIGEWEEIEQVGGEDQGSHWHSVKYFKDHDVYIKTTGFYSSYNGTDFYNGYGEEVKPVEKTVVVFEAK